MKVKDCVPGLECDLVFSGLPSSIAGEVEMRLPGRVRGAQQLQESPDGRRVRCWYRKSTRTPRVDVQQKNQNYKNGYIITNPNCSTMALVLALAPLESAFGIDKVHVVTMQALSGAGYPGVASLDIIDNVIPYIADEEEKIEIEPCKILGETQEWEGCVRRLQDQRPMPPRKCAGWTS